MLLYLLRTDWAISCLHVASDKQVELTGLPGAFWIEDQSVAIKGSGHCTILDVALSDCAEPPPAEDVRHYW